MISVLYSPFLAVNGQSHVVVLGASDPRHSANALLGELHDADVENLARVAGRACHGWG